MNIADELQKLEQLRRSGAISETEFERAKAKILDGQTAAPFMEGVFGGDTESQTRQWGMVLHLSMLLGHLIPYAGLIVPILIWQLKKNDLPGIDEHGKNAANWIISAIIYSVACFILMFVVVGFVLFPILLLLGVIFPIVAAIKANGGETWKYPGAIKFFA